MQIAGDLPDVMINEVIPRAQSTPIKQARLSIADFTLFFILIPLYIISVLLVIVA